MNIEETLKNSVFESLDNALENGYDLRKWTDHQIAVDLVTYDADLENEEPDTLIKYIHIWKENHK